MKPYYFDNSGRFVIENYEKRKPFSSFLPGIAGVKGIPLWAYYVNRGQGLASFGVEDKDGAIMEFLPAHQSYQRVPTQGFRTFIKYRTEKEEGYYEPFSMLTKQPEKTKMFISQNEFSVSSYHEVLGIEVFITYFILPNESFGALVRKVEVKNLGQQPIELEVLDGAPYILPYGINNGAYKELGYTLKSWFDVYHLEEKTPLYKLRGSIADSAEVNEIVGGHFYFCFKEIEGSSELLQPLVDGGNLFGSNTSLSEPDGFINQGLHDLMGMPQVTTNKVPCAFSGTKERLASGKSFSLNTLIGHVRKIESVSQRLSEMVNSEYIDQKRREAAALTQQLTDDMSTETALPLFNEYCRQNYLDNLLRGGYPLLLDNGTKKPYVYHVYSRKHGDLERDYNFFKLLPSYYSQGNGNFRDANQNRRSDVFFHPEVEDFNIRMFMSFIQADGYNPLVVKGCSFHLRDVEALFPYLEESTHAQVRAFFNKAYTPGEVIHLISQLEGACKVSAEELLGLALQNSEQHFEADFGEGYWIDHWTYNMDLIESYLGVYPDKLQSMLFDERAYTYYDSFAQVVPRKDKHVLTPDGKVRQYGAVVESEHKEALLKSRKGAPQWARTANGKGEIYRSNLYEKLLSLAAIKFATLDPEGVGIEMEANKPGWNDSLNGLPGVFASGFSELSELKRILVFLAETGKHQPEGSSITLPMEMKQLISQLIQGLETYYLSPETSRDHQFWEMNSQAREDYREKVQLGFDGEEAKLSIQACVRFLEKCLNKVNEGMEKALEIGNGIYPTYFMYEAIEFEVLCDGNGQALTNSKGLKKVKVNRFKRTDLPYFLEGPTRAMKVMDQREEQKRLYDRIKQSGLYDKKLGMYKVNESLLEQPKELGRSRAFTPGWLENESVFMHMEFKYMLELLKAGLYDAFYEDLRTVLPPFMDPEVYGRSPLENSSFIASSANPDSSLHGTGFIARLSGSTAEFIQMWLLMMAGHRPFQYEDGQLKLSLRPNLPHWMFGENHQAAFRFLGSCRVTYHNPSGKDAYLASVDHYVITMVDGKQQKVEGSSIVGELAHAVRQKQVSHIDVHLV